MCHVTSDFDHEFNEAVQVLTSYVLISIWLMPNSCDVCKCICGHPIVISNFFGLHNLTTQKLILCFRMVISNLYSVFTQEQLALVIVLLQ